MELSGDGRRPPYDNNDPNKHDEPSSKDKTPPKNDLVDDEENAEGSDEELSPQLRSRSQNVTVLGSKRNSGEKGKHSAIRQQRRSNETSNPSGSTGPANSSTVDGESVTMEGQADYGNGVQNVKRNLFLNDGEEPSTSQGVRPSTSQGEGPSTSQGEGQRKRPHKKHGEKETKIRSSDSISSNDSLEEAKRKKRKPAEPFPADKFKEYSEPKEDLNDDAEGVQAMILNTVGTRNRLQDEHEDVAAVGDRVGVEEGVEEQGDDNREDEDGKEKEDDENEIVDDMEEEGRANEDEMNARVDDADHKEKDEDMNDKKDEDDDEKMPTPDAEIESEEEE